MKHALIFPDRPTLVAQVEAEPFPVHPACKWLPCPDNCVSGWTHDPTAGTFTAPVVPTQAEIDAAALEAIAAEVDRADNVVTMELLLVVFAALRELIPDLDAKPYVANIAPYLAGVTTKAAFREAVIARRNAIRNAG